MSDGYTKKEAEEIVRSVEQLFGELGEIDEAEADSLYEEFGPGVEPLAYLHGLASEVAAGHRLSKQLVPDHLQAILKATRPVSLEGASRSQLSSIIDRVLHPTFGAVESLAPAFRGRKADLAESDRSIVEDLSRELEGPWDEEKPE